MLYAETKTPHSSRVNHCKAAETAALRWPSGGADRPSFDGRPKTYVRKALSRCCHATALHCLAAVMLLPYTILLLPCTAVGPRERQESHKQPFGSRRFLRL